LRTIFDGTADDTGELRPTEQPDQLAELGAIVQAVRREFVLALEPDVADPFDWR
jgi:hypothetical protein